MGLQMCPFNASFELLLDLRNIRVALRGSALPAEHRAAPQDEYRSGVPLQTAGEPSPTPLYRMRSPRPYSEPLLRRRAWPSCDRAGELPARYVLPPPSPLLCSKAGLARTWPAPVRGASVPAALY